MADAYKGLTIEFAGDTTKLSAALSKVNGDIKTANGNIASLNRALKIDPGNLSLMGDKVQAAAAKVDATKQRLDALTQAQAKLAASGDTTSATYQRVSREIETGQVYLQKYEKELENAKSVYETHKTALGQLGQKMIDVSETAKKSAEKIKAVGTAITVATTAITTGSLSAFEAVDTAQDNAVRKTGATGDAADALARSVENVGTSAAAAKDDWADIGNVVGNVQTKFGLTGDALDALSQQFLEFGENTGTTAADDVETVAQAMDIFNVSADQTQNVLGLFQATSQATGASVTDLMSQVQTNGATFQSMGLSIGQSITLLGSFEQSGYDSNQMLAALKKAAAEYNSEGKDMSTGLADLVTRLQDSSTSAEATSEAYDLFGKRAGTTFVKAAQSGKVNLTDLSASLSDYATTVDDTFSQTEDGIDRGQQAFKSLQVAGAKLGEAISNSLGPVLTAVSDQLNAMADALGSLTPEQQQMVVGALAVTAALGGVLLVVGTVVMKLAEIGTAILSVASSMTASGGVMAAIASGPVLLIVAAIAGVIAALVYMWNTNEGFRDAVTSAWATIQASAEQMWSVIGPVLTGIANVLSAVLVPALQAAAGVVGAVFGGAFEAVAAVISGAMLVIAGIIEAIVGTIELVIGAFVGVFTGNWQMASDGASSIMQGFGDIITGILNGVLGAIGGILNAIVDSFSSILNGITGIVSGIFGAAASAISDRLGDAQNAVSDALGNIASFFANLHIEWPHINIPHFTVSGSFNLDPANFSVPSIGIDWYAKGAIISGASVVGVGEHGPEAITPISKLSDLMADALDKLSTRSDTAWAIKSQRPVNIYQTTKVIASDEDVYAAATIANRSLMSAVTQYI